MRVSDFCPNDCVWLSDDVPSHHESCKHVSDVLMPTPFSAIFMNGNDKRVVTVVGINGSDYYVEEIMTNGGTSRMSVSRDKIKRS